jgi:hypothetical protein
MLSLLLAAQLQLPVPSDATVRHLLYDFPDASEEQVASARVALWISAKGKVRDCRIVAYGGDKTFAEQLCEKIIGARFEPARDGAGNRVPSLFTIVLGASGSSVHRSGTMMNWMSGASAPADFVINLSALPPGLAWNPRVAVNVLIDEAGRVASCEGDGAPDSQKWIAIACQEAGAGKFEAMTSEAAEPVAYIRNLVVKFETQD